MPFLTPGFLVISLIEIIINKEYYINNLRSDIKTRTELFIKDPANFYRKMKSRLHIGIIGYCPTLAGTLVSALIAEEVAKKFPDKDVKINWIEPEDHEKLLEKIFPEEKIRLEYEITRGIPVFEGLVPITSKNPPVRSNFDFQKQRKQRFPQDIKSIKIKAKRR